jgi:hypothetical protein
LGVPSSVPVCSPPSSSPSYLLTSLLNSSSLVLDYPRVVQNNQLALDCGCVRHQPGGGGTIETTQPPVASWILMETMGLVGDQTGEDASRSGVVGADGGVVEGWWMGDPLTRGYTRAGSC